jgi:hypothetical protein
MFMDIIGVLFENDVKQIRSVGKFRVFQMLKQAVKTIIAVI